MILRRIADAIRRQDWFQVTIEIFIVVIGIFLGLQVSEWDDRRAQREEEVGYLARLHEDFSQTILENESQIQDAFNLWVKAKIVSDSLASCQLEDKDKDDFAVGLWGIAKFLAVSLQGTTIEELKSTGKFQIIQSIDLRTAISKNVDEVMKINTIVDKMFDYIRPHVTLVEMNYSPLMADPDINFPEPNITWNNRKIDFEKLCSNDEFKGSFNHIYEYVTVLYYLSQPVLDQQRAIIVMLEAELAEKS